MKCIFYLKNINQAALGLKLKYLTISYAISWSSEYSESEVQYAILFVLRVLALVLMSSTGLEVFIMEFEGVIFIVFPIILPFKLSIIEVFLGSGLIIVGF